MECRRTFKVNIVLMQKRRNKFCILGNFCRDLVSCAFDTATEIMSKKCDLFQYTVKDELEVYKTYGRTPESFAEDVDTVREWSKKQLHFPEVPRKLLTNKFAFVGAILNIVANVLIKSFLRSSKCSVERVKQRLDMYYTIRNFAAEFFRHPLTPEVIEQTKYVYVCQFLSIKNQFRFLASMYPYQS